MVEKPSSLYATISRKKESCNIMRVVDIDIYKILLEEKLCENILIYEISYKPFMDAKPLDIRFDKIDGFTKICDGTR